MADIEERMKKTIDSLKDSFNTIRTGRANAAIFDKVRVDYYGTKSPLNQVATIAIPEARSVIITPFDKSLISEIEKAIQVADLGLNPSNDGKVIRIQIPALTADRRKELVKQAKTVAENSRTAIRNIRRDGNDDLKKQQKDGTLTEDGLKTETDKLQKLTDKYIEEMKKEIDIKLYDNLMYENKDDCKIVTIDMDSNEKPYRIVPILEENNIENIENRINLGILTAPVYTISN